MSATTPPLPPAFVGASNAPLVHCSPQKMVWGETRTEAGSREAVTESNRMWIFLGGKQSAMEERRPTGAVDD
jgi:hypothetical protein